VSSESWASSPGTRKSMQSNKARDTKPELALRSAVHALGLRYRVDARPLKDVRRRADLLFTRAKVAVFLDGCFWHGCPKCGHIPSSNRPFWKAKIERNQRRDRETDELLLQTGIRAIRFWEHELRDCPRECMQRLLTDLARGIGPS
jgi:DNA mismatch endonuclease, patch repair protein